AALLPAHAERAGLACVARCEAPRERDRTARGARLGEGVAQGRDTAPRARRAIAREFAPSLPLAHARTSPEPPRGVASACAAPRVACPSLLGLGRSAGLDRSITTGSRPFIISRRARGRTGCARPWPRVRGRGVGPPGDRLSTRRAARRLTARGLRQSAAPAKLHDLEGGEA